MGLLIVSILAGFSVEANKKSTKIFLTRKKLCSRPKVLGNLNPMFVLMWLSYMALTIGVIVFTWWNVHDFCQIMRNL